MEETTIRIAGHVEHGNPSHWAGDQTGESNEVGDNIIHIPAKAMRIGWGNDERFWRWIELSKDELPNDLCKDERCICTVAELIQVNWLEVAGALDLAKHKQQLLPSRAYEVIYHIKFNVDAFGWSKAPVTFQLTMPDFNREKRSEIMESYRRRSNEWHEVQGGEFQVPEGATGKVEFSMHDVQSHWWKGGMVFAGVTIRPKKDRHV